ncbi:hypothetical protein [Streptomyces sp. NPDC048002]|uniref:hypothetical protein n=1 Tax=Streptomyces sp. NPDC048002 TaxID=3154344 RepID=UPI0034099A68
MTAVPAEATAAAPPTLARGPHGLLWLTLRVHRTALLSWSAPVAVFSGALLWAYGPGDDAARAEYLETGCGAGRPNLGCDMPGPAFERYDYVLGVSGALLAFLPLLAAAWAGGALIGRELEQGTARLAWVQSVTPTRWLAAKLAVPAALLAAGTTATVLLGVWARGADDPNLVGDWYHPETFIGTGPTAVAYALSGLALGALAGTALGRALPAAGAAAAGALLLRELLERYRPDLWPTVVRDTADGEVPRSALQVSGTETLVTLHPPSHFWPIQYVETGVLLALTAAAVVGAFALLRHRAT